MKIRIAVISFLALANHVVIVSPFQQKPISYPHGDKANTFASQDEKLPHVFHYNKSMVTREYTHLFRSMVDDRLR